MSGFLRHAGATLIAIGIVAAVVAIARSAIFAPNAACVSRSRELVIALQQYVQDNDERFPAQMSTPAEFKAALLPYAISSSEFICPATNKPYAPNSALSGQFGYAFNQGSTVAFQDSVPHSDGLLTVTYLDGTVTRGGVVQGDPTTIGVQYASNLVQATLQYTQDYDEKLPPTDTQADFQTAVGPYVRDSRDFYSPQTGQPFAPNSAISEMSLSQISQPFSQVVVVQSSVPEPDGLLTIGYLDGHVVHGDQPLPAPSAVHNLRAIGLAALQYTQDHDEFLPPTTSYSAFESALSPYIQNPSVFTDPDSGLPFVLNKSISGVSLASIVNPAGTYLLKAPTLDPNGVLYMGYVDGHAAGKGYHIVRTMAVGADNDTRLVWYWSSSRHNRYDYGGESLWNVDPSGPILSRTAIGAGIGTLSASVEPDSSTRLLSSNAEIAYPFPAAASFETVTVSDKVSARNFGPFDGWTPTAIGAGANDQPVALWDYYDGTAAVWLMYAQGGYDTSVNLSPPSGGSAIDLAVGADNNIHVLWANSDGSATIQTLSSAGVSQGSVSYGALSGYSPAGLVVDPNGNLRLLWDGSDGSAEVWTISSTGTVLGQQDLAGQSGWHAAKIGVGGDGNLRVLWINIDDTARLDIVQPDGTIASSTFYEPYYTG